MAAGLFKAPTENFWSDSLNGAINDSVTTITLNDTSGLQAPGYVIINRQDGNGNNTPNSREVVKFTGISSNDLTGCTRGADNSTARSHSDGALVETMYFVGMHNDQRDAINAEHNTDGTHSIISSTTITTLDAGTANIDTLNVTTLTPTNEVAKVTGQFYWSRSGALATSSPSVAGDTHFPLIRATKDLTINELYVSLTSAPSTAAFQADISFGSSPTGDFASVFTTEPTIDVGEYDTTTAATPAVLSLTSLASGALLRFEIDAPGDAGNMGASLQVESR
jgi:hypothetical protein